MNKKGYETSLSEGQYSESGELVGQVTIQTDNEDNDYEISLNLGQSYETTIKH